MDEYDAGHRDGQAAAAAYYDRDAEIERLRASLCKERAERERLEKAEESRLRAMSMASIVDEMRLLDGVDNLTEIERLRTTLGYYSDKSAWTKVVLDSYSGEVDIFDWDGDLGDEPWEMAERALRGESDEVMMSDKTTLEDRVQQFAAMKLPGQPQFMHTGTSYLVNDLWREITRLRELLLAALEESDPYWRVEAHRKLEEDGDE